MDRLSVEGRMVVRANASGQLTPVRGGTALHNHITNTIYGRTSDGKLARVGGNGNPGDICYLGQNKDMFFPSGVPGDAKHLSRKRPFSLDDLLAPASWTDHARRAAPYAIGATASVLGAMAGHVMLDVLHAGADSISHAFGYDHFGAGGGHSSHDTGHEVDEAGSHPDHSPNYHGVHEHLKPGAHHIQHYADPADGHSAHASQAHSSTTHRLTEMEMGPFAIAEALESSRFYDTQCLSFHQQMTQLVSMTKRSCVLLPREEIGLVMCPPCPEWPTFRDPYDIELVARSVVAAHDACMKAYKREQQRKAGLPWENNEPPLNHQELLHKDGMPKLPPEGVSIPAFLRTKESHTQKEQEDAAMLGLATLIGGAIGMVGGRVPMLTLAALGFIAAAYLRGLGVFADNADGTPRT